MLGQVFTFALNDIDETVLGPMSVNSWTLPEFKDILAKQQWNIHERGGWNALVSPLEHTPRHES